VLEYMALDNRYHVTGHPRRCIVRQVYRVAQKMAVFLARLHFIKY